MYATQASRWHQWLTNWPVAKWPVLGNRKATYLKHQLTCFSKFFQLRYLELEGMAIPCCGQKWIVS